MNPLQKQCSLEPRGVKMQTPVCSSPAVRPFFVGVCLAVATLALLSGCGPSSASDEKLKAAEIIKQEAAKAEQKRWEEAEKEKHRLEKLNYLGMWEMGEYVDEFKEKTGEIFFTNKRDIKGTFKNSATDGSELEVDFVIDKEGIFILLHEYGRSRVKHEDRQYSTYIQDKDSNRIHIWGLMKRDRIQLLQFAEKSGGKEQVEQVFHSIMMKGGPIKFFIQDLNRRDVSYFFTISDPSSYENALKKLNEKK